MRQRASWSHGVSRPLRHARGGTRRRDGRHGALPQASRYQLARCDRSLSQLAIPGRRSLLEMADAFGRLTIGMTLWAVHTRSFILIKRAARLTGSSSTVAAR